jgi:hypothetical protein
MASFLSGIGGAISGLGPTVQTLGQGLQVNQLAQMQQARNNAAKSLVMGLPSDEYGALQQAGNISGDWLWTMGQVSGPEGELLRQQHYAATVKQLMSENPGMSYQQAAAQASLQEGDPETFAKLMGEGKGKAQVSGEDQRTWIASQIGKLPKSLNDDATALVNDPNASDYALGNMAKRIEGYQAKELNVTRKPFKTTTTDESGTTHTWEGEEEEHEVEMPPEADPSAAAGGPGPPVSGAPPGSAAIGPAPAGSSAGTLTPPPPPPDVATPPSVPTIPVVPGRRVINLHEVPGPAATMETMIQKNLQQMGTTSLDVQNKMLALGGGDINKAVQIFDNSKGERAVKGFFKQYPGKLGEVMQAIKTFNERQPVALKASQQILSRYSAGTHAESPIGVTSGFWDVMSILQDTNDTISTSIHSNGWTPKADFGRFKPVAELQAEAAERAAGGGGGSSAAPGPKDPHGREMYFKPGP